MQSADKHVEFNTIMLDLMRFIIARWFIGGMKPKTVIDSPFNAITWRDSCLDDAISEQLMTLPSKFIAT